MTDQLILQLIVTVITYCNGPGSGNIPYLNNTKDDMRNTVCFNQIWKCGHNVLSSMAIVTETHNCITKHTKGELK